MLLIPFDEPNLGHRRSLAWIAYTRLSPSIATKAQLRDWRIPLNDVPLTLGRGVAGCRREGLVQLIHSVSGAIWARSQESVIDGCNSLVPIKNYILWYAERAQPTESNSKRDMPTYIHSVLVAMHLGLCDEDLDVHWILRGRPGCGVG